MQRIEPPQDSRQSPNAAFGAAGAANPSPAYDGPIEAHEASSPSRPDALLECLQAWVQRRLHRQQEAAAGPRLHYRIRWPSPPPGAGRPESKAAPGAAGEAAFDRAVLAAALAGLTPPLPQPLHDALLHGWPDRLQGLHRIELVPGEAWLSIEIGLRRATERRLAGRLDALRRPAGMSTRDAIIVGAGIAGCAMADALARRGWQVVVLESGHRAGGAVAGIPLLAQHPALSPGGDRRSRLLVAALLASRRHADRFGDAMTWCGRFQPMPLDEARSRTEGVPATLAVPIARSTIDEHGVAGMQGIWFPGCAMADPQRWWCRVLQSPLVELRLSQPAAGIERQADRWHALDARGQAIASAGVMILANQSGALALSAMPVEATGRLRHSRIQVAIGSAATAATRRPSILGGSSYRLEDPGRCCVIGPLQPGVDSLARHPIDLPPPTIGDPAYSWRLSAIGERLLMRDNLPMIGSVPDLGAIDADRHRYERNDRLPLPRRESLHLIAGLGGRGLLWSVIGAEIIAAQVNHEPPVVEPELEDAVDPARFLRRSLRRSPPQAEGMNVLSS